VSNNDSQIPLVYDPVTLGHQDSLVISTAIRALQLYKPRGQLLNLAEPDTAGHWVKDKGWYHAERRLYLSFDKDLGRLIAAYKAAGIYDQTLFVITADHGMAPLRRFVPKSVFTKAVAQAGTTAPAISYNAGTYIWLRDPTRARLVALDVLAARDPGIQSAYYLTTVRGKPQYQRAGGALVSPEVDAANRYLLSTLINGHQPQVVVFCKTTATGSSPATGWKADHGGSGWQSQHIPLIISGPGIREGVISGGPAQLDDVAPTILRAMGVAPTGMQGRVLTDALQAPTSADLRARKAEVSQINPLENALIAQDNYETAH
jgi:arylsulfatase A-like enzyme